MTDITVIVVCVALLVANIASVWGSYVTYRSTKRRAEQIDARWQKEFGGRDD